MKRSAFLAAAATVVSSSIVSAQGPDFIATAAETILNTSSTQVMTTTGPVTVTGGVFYFNSVTIPAGKVVRGVGPNPMIWVVNSMRVDGILSADGQDGTRVNTLQSANFAKPGGLGGPAGGNGGSGTPNITMQSFTGAAGSGPGNTPGFGGGGGLLSFVTGCGRGSGGGGGSFATAGDPWFHSQASGGTSFLQRRGFGGLGCVGGSGAASRTLLPGAAGPVIFQDAQLDNNFFGFGYNFATQQLIAGELQSLVGGAGGGGGGDLSSDDTLLSANWAMDASGGGGGGGGGCLVIAAQTDIEVGDIGRISANGGHGGGGEQAGSCNRGAGGGGGSGGLVILAARGQIVLNVHGETYANNDYDFILSADGGVCATSFLPPIIPAKYPVSGQPTMSGTFYDQRPLGGFGGMGIVQLATRPGTNLDNTNTVLDDNIVVVRNGLTLAGSEKQRFLAWRGFANQSGQGLDDSGNVIVIGNNEGDIRPTPILLPVF